MSKKPFEIAQVHRRHLQFHATFSGKKEAACIALHKDSLMLSKLLINSQN
jgi:hypothetical protein